MTEQSQVQNGLNTGVHLLTYADRLGGTIPELGNLLGGPLDHFSGVHILPFFLPYDGEDAGFDPVDHCAVDPRLGGWSDVKALKDSGKVVMADIIVNHMSADSPQFQDWLALGEDSQYDGLFLTFDRVFPTGASEAGITSFYRPRPGMPFTPFRTADGSRRLVWTTFMPSQVDIDVTHPAGIAYLEGVLDALVAGGVSIVRVDAVGYAIKNPETDSFMTDDTLAFVEVLADMCHRRGLDVLVEVHAHYTQQQAIAKLVDYVYDFATPALLLDAFVSTEPGALVRWLDERPGNAVTVLDTHDGIGIIDAGPINDMEGLISEEQMAAIFEWANDNTAGESGAASVQPQWASMPHQINSTFFHTLGQDPTRYLLARAFQLFLPGLPQIYYVGLLAGVNDVEAWKSSGEGREINRHRYTPAELEEALQNPVVRAQLALVDLRTQKPAFAGSFSFEQPSKNSVELRWVNGEHRATLFTDFSVPSFRITVDGPDGRLSYESSDDLAKLLSR